MNLEAETTSAHCQYAAEHNERKRGFRGIGNLPCMLALHGRVVIPFHLKRSTCRLGPLASE